jgi:hypothetical protein
MEWLSFDGVNWLAVLLAFLLSFAFGWWYYSSAGVFKPWAKAAGVSPDVVQNSNMAVAFGGTILANALGVILLAVLMAGVGVTGWWQGLVFGAVLGLVFRGGAHALHNGFAGRSPKVTLFDAVHDTVALGLAGLVLGLMA